MKPDGKHRVSLILWKFTATRRLDKLEMMFIASIINYSYRPRCIYCLHTLIVSISIPSYTMDKWTPNESKYTLFNLPEHTARLVQSESNWNFRTTNKVAIISCIHTQLYLLIYFSYYLQNTNTTQIYKYSNSL